MRGYTETAVCSGDLLGPWTITRRTDHERIADLRQRSRQAFGRSLGRQVAGDAHRPCIKYLAFRNRGRIFHALGQARLDWRRDHSIWLYGRKGRLVR